jgi:hypothetical protein
MNSGLGSLSLVSLIKNISDLTGGQRLCIFHHFITTKIVYCKAWDRWHIKSLSVSFFWVVLGFELRTLCEAGTHLSHPPPPPPV